MRMRNDRRDRSTLAMSIATAVVALLCTPAIFAAEAEPASQRFQVRMAQFDPESSWARADILVTGARVFDNRCAACHGNQGHGDGELADVLPIRPRNYHEEDFKWGSSPSKIATTIASGRSGIMPPFKLALSEEEIWAVAYVVWRWIPETRRSLDAPNEARNWRLP